MQVSGFRIYFLEPGYFFSKILSEFRKKIVALQEGFTLNPGSVSLPKNGSRRSYLTAEGTAFSWKDLETGETWQTLDLEHPEDR